MRAGSWDRRILGELTLEGERYLALDMAFDYTTKPCICSQTSEIQRKAAIW